MQDVLARYISEFTGKRRIPCPIHNGKDDNFTYDERGFMCFSCGARGSVIDFVMLYFGINIQQAAVRLDSDFRLGIIGSKPDPVLANRAIAARREAERALRNYRAEYDHNIAEYRRLWFARGEKAPTSPTEKLDPGYVEALDRLPELDYWFNTHHWK